MKVLEILCLLSGLLMLSNGGVLLEQGDYGIVVFDLPTLKQRFICEESHYLPHGYRWPLHLKDSIYYTHL